jgi:hypothetical protein
MKVIATLLLVLGICLGLLMGCGDEGSNSPGTEGGICLPNNKCDPGLSCWDGICQPDP